MRERESRGLVLVMIGCFFILSCGGGGGGSESSSTSDTTKYTTGNQDFELADAVNADPLGDYRTEADVGDSLPTRVDYATIMPRVRNQGNTGSCTSWAGGYYIKSYQETVEEGWDVDDNAFSPGYLYAMQCRHYSEYSYNGRYLTSPRNLIATYGTIKKYGCAKWNTMPYEDLYDGNSQNSTATIYANLEIGQSVHEEARIYRCGDMTFANTINQVKHALTQGPVLLGINEYDVPPQNPSPEENYLSYNAGNDDRGHAIALVGYDDTKFGTGAFKFINSWGAGWAEDGFSWIRYSDAPNIIFAAMTYQDLVNPETPDDDPDEDQRPDPPTDVDASDDIGSYVDVTWSPVSGAKYYRIYRAEVDDNGYEAIGTAYQGSFRDYPSLGIDYYYAVVAVNDLGESDHYASDTDSEGHIDIGSAIGDQLITPTLAWLKNDGNESYFSVANIDSAATAMEVLVSKFSTGPWDSFGWIDPGDFRIKWDANSEYTNKKPYVRVRMTNASASSDPSNTEQVGEDIYSDVEVGQLNVAVFDAQPSSMLLRWMVTGNVDYVEIWRYCASNNIDNDWVKIGYCDSSEKGQDGFISYEDTTPMPGVPYYYALVPVFQGTYGKIEISAKPYRVAAEGPNLNVVSYQYYYTQITPYTDFPNVVVRNDGGTDVPGYSIGILAKSWSDGSVKLVGRLRMNSTLAADEQHRFNIDDFLIPDEFAGAGMFSWGIMVDYDESIDEIYESDNTKWSTDGWWLPPTYAAAASQTDAKAQSVRLGSTQRFKSTLDKPAPQQASESYGAMTAVDDLELKYNGPAVFEQPDFCIRHDKRK